MRNNIIVAIFSAAFGILIAGCVNMGGDVANSQIDVWEAMGAPPSEKVNARDEWCMAFRDGLMPVTEYQERRTALEMAFYDCLSPTR